MSKKTEDTRARLLVGALRVFAQHGFEGASMRQIAQHAGVAPGLAYHYFESKEAMLRSLLVDGAEKLQANFAEAAGITEPRLRIATLIRAAGRTIAENPEYFKLSAGLRAQPRTVGGLASEFEQLQGALVEQWARWLGEADCNDAVADAHLTIAALTGIAQDAADSPDYPLEHVLERLIARLLSPIASGVTP